MSRNQLPSIRRRRVVLWGCCMLGTFVGLARLSDGLFPVFVGGFESELFNPKPGRTLRVIESVGILLPLFAGLLRLTTSDQSDVSEQVNDYLLLGILGLVLAGVLAALAGFTTNVAGILKISLFFVLLTFAVIGFAAMGMFEEIPTSTDWPGPNFRSNDTVAENSPPQRSGAETEDVEDSGGRTTGDEEGKVETTTGSETEIGGDERTGEASTSETRNQADNRD